MNMNINMNINIDIHINNIRPPRGWRSAFGNDPQQININMNITY